MTGEEKLEFIRKQIQTRDVDKIDCPYCGGESNVGQNFCCQTLLKAFNVILDAIEIAEKLDFAKRIQDRIYVN